MNRREFLKTNAKWAGMIFTGLAINPRTAYSRPSKLRITDIRGCTVASNYDYPIIKIYTNQDIYGLGEVRDAGYLGEALILKPLLVGKDPLDIEGILETIRPWAGHGRSGGGFSAVDMALFDIAGKALGVQTMFHHAGSPVGAMASVHCACTLRDFVSMENHAMDIPWWEDLVTGVEKPLIKDGRYTVPEKPGLGIELNDEIVPKFLREPRFIYKAGYFQPTPEFDQPMSKEEAVKKRIIARNGLWYNHGGPWVHLNEHGELVNKAGSR